MTKARDLANIISGGFTADDIPNLPATKITSGELANARVADLPTSKVTSGTFADARIAASNVTQHVTPTDLTELEQDVMILGLHTATARNSSETDLSSSHVIRFEDDSQIASETTGDRNATSECWSSVSSTETSIPVKFLLNGTTNAAIVRSIRR